MLLSDMISIQTPQAKKIANENQNIWNYLGQSQNETEQEPSKVENSENRDRIASFDEI